MIDWTMLAANSLWILGLSVLLAAWSYRSYIRSLHKEAAQKTGVPVDVSNIEPYFRLGMVLFVLGQVAVSGLSGEVWWRILLWTVLLILLLVEPTIALWRNRAELSARWGWGGDRLDPLNPVISLDRWKVAAVLAIALIQGGVYLFVMPPWQHYDEPSHFEYAWLLANTDGGDVTAADRDITLNREVTASREANDFYWNLGDPFLLSDQPSRLGYDQFDNRPLYYQLAAIPLRTFSHLDLASQVRLARMVSLLFFLLAVLSAAGTMHVLTVPGHPLRWAIPLALTFLPPFADIMTAVNNDAGAFGLFALFLWGSVYMIRRGITPLSASWVLLAGMLAFGMKNTALMSLPLIPVAFVLAFWRQRKWAWRWLGLAAGMAALVALLGVTQLSDARYWYHWDAWGTQTIQTITSRQRTAETTIEATTNPPVGEFAVTVPLDPAAKYHRLLNPLLRESVQAIAGETVTVGGWFWTDADEPLVVPGPKLLWSETGTRTFGAASTSITVTNTPVFHAVTVEVPENTALSYYSLEGNPGNASLAEPARLFLDGAVVVLGDFPAEEPPQFSDGQGVTGTWAGEPIENLLRNGSAAQSWPRVRGQAENLIFRAAQRSPTLILNGLLDWPRNGRLLGRSVPQHLIQGLLGYFAWSHVRLQGDLWLPLYWVVLGLALAGTGWWLVRMARPPRRRRRRKHRDEGEEATGSSGETGRRRSRRRHGDHGERNTGVVPAVLFLGLSGFLVWTNAALWVVTNMWIAAFLMPSTRYTFPAALPTILLTVAGVAGLVASNRKVQRWVIYAMVAAFFVLNVVGLWTIREFYSNLPI